MISHDVPRQRESPTDNSPGGLRQGEKRHPCRNREWSGDGQRKGWTAADMALFTGSFENKLERKGSVSLSALYRAQLPAGVERLDPLFASPTHQIGRASVGEHRCQE